MNTNLDTSLVDNLMRKINLHFSSQNHSNSLDKFCGIWTGTMYTANSSAKKDVVVTIRSRFNPGKVCGEIISKDTGDRSVLIFDTTNGEVLSYSCSTSVKDDRSAQNMGKLIVRPDGTLFRVHQEQDLIVSGSLKRE